ncbi:MAG: hypothetical protein IJV04_01780, partial [Lachnospiraceae bacterium]|nr:hypothetical protein [Lachnospiraceae bacterium]
MAAFSYDSLKETYKDFLYPMVEIQVEGTSIADDRNQIPFSNVVVDLTSGFEANQATYDLYNCFDPFTSEFQFAKVKKYILIGSQVSIYMGYSSQLREVFRGVICKVD